MKSPRILILGNGQALENYAKKMFQWLVDRHDITFARTRGTMDYLEWHHIQEHIKQRIERLDVDPPEQLASMLISLPAYDRTTLDKNQTLKELFMNGRFYRMTCMIWASYHNLLPRWARSQVWFTVIDPAFYVERPELCQDVWKIFFSWIPGESSFATMLAEHAKAGHVLISDRSHCRKGIAEHVFWDE